MIRTLTAALGFVLLVTATFALIGSFSSDAPVAADDDTTDAVDASPPPDESDEPQVAGAIDTDAPKLIAASPIARPEPPPFDAEQPDGNGDPNGDSDTGEDGFIDPSEITVQVLDGYRQDGGTAAAQVTTELQEAGYRVVAENPAIAYEVTTVLWSPGNEAAAWQVAEVLGATQAREQPDNLSANVVVHVVVGADRAS